MGGVPRQWKERFGRKGEAIDESLKAVLNETLGFQKLLVINMPERTDRRDAVTLAAGVSNMKIEFVMGVRGESVPEVALPPGVYQNLSTALIFEDDVDWDVRLRPQLQAFALASRWLSDDPKISKGISYYSIGVTQNPETAENSIHNSSSLNPISKDLFSVSLPSAMMDVQHRDPRISPYGDPENWDLLWLGHCGAGFPRQPADAEAIGRHNILLADPNDPTVPMPSYLRAHPFGPLDALGETHPPHTRVYHRASGGALCTVAYAVSQRGARRLLHEFGIKKWSRIWDVEMGDWCAGDDFAAEKRDKAMEERKKRGQRKCITSQPPIFAHHHPPGGESDIGGLGGGYARNIETKYVRLSTRMNLEALLRGDPEETLVDQWPDY
ncbi:glycosyltransferase family 25 protein [Hyaloscypha variabilis F]|uniref:Glycosyltransferase family 25 protein n=1 Tax=Hyaloscypha variabilis (strain UAMH 11265 / GT02V1 / F) TaxID=1149755 RepID=A0A2J6R3U7_HYAVF|nr:glycosyltransferase family 25 protein [Hyaloscypha variabilis F]